MTAPKLAPRLVLGFDPSPNRSGVVLYDAANREIVGPDAAAAGHLGPHAAGNPKRGGRWLWTDLGLDGIRRAMAIASELTSEAGLPLVVAIERMRSQGRANPDIFVTLETYGRIVEMAHVEGLDCIPLPRIDVIRTIGVKPGKNTDGAVVQCMLYEHGGDKASAVGTKAAPGPLYRCASHAWQALAVAHAVARRKGWLGPRPDAGS